MSTASVSKATFDSLVDNYLPEDFRQFIEEHFYAKVATQARLEHLKNDPLFHHKPLKHIGLYTDHGVVHVRDVTLQTLEVINTANGTLIPRREKGDLETMRACGLQLAYLHDIGMADFSEFGRFMHPEFAAQFVYCPEFEPYLELLWQENAGNIPWKLMRLFGQKHREPELRNIYRELLSLSVGHSKSKMPINIINHPALLRSHMINILGKPLQRLYFEQKTAKLRKASENSPDPEKVKSKKLATLEKKQAEWLSGAPDSAPSFTGHYRDYRQEAFAWLLYPDPACQKFVVNVLDSLRCLRAADALRQRGTVLRTSAGYEIFVDRKTANAIYALRDDANNELFMLEGKKSINAGEANLASSELDQQGNLRVSFHLGAFHKKRIVQKAASNAAFTIDDIQADVLQSFQRNTVLDQVFTQQPATPFAEIKILVEATDDNPEFAGLVCDKLAEMNPDIAHRVETTISLQGSDLPEVRRYITGEPLQQRLGAIDFHQALYRNLRKAGYDFDPGRELPGLKDIRIIRLKNGEELIKSGSPSGFVYFPLSEGLRVYPLGGYESKSARAWIPIGNTGVIRGSVRNAQVLAESEVELICVPKSIYLTEWYRPYSPKELLRVWQGN